MEEHNSTAAATTVIAAAAACNGREEQSRGGRREGYVGVPVHSQVMKIKQEIEKIKHPSLQQPETRRVRLRDVSRLRSRSPLGLTERAILVGNS